MRPHGTHPLPFLDDVRVGFLDELAHPAQRLPTPVPELGDALVDQLRCGLFHALHDGEDGVIPFDLITAAASELPR